MERSVFGSAVKTYPSKSNRVSRSYRPSYLTVEDAFDKLISEEKLKPVSIKENFNIFTSSKNAADNIIDKKLSLNNYKRRTTLKNIQNTEFSDRVSSMSTQSNYRLTNSEYYNKNKENTYKFSSRLFVSDSDSSGQLDKSSVYNNLTDLEENNENTTIKRKKHKKKFKRPTKSSLHYTRKATSKMKRLNQYRMKFRTKTTNNRQLLNAVSTPRCSSCDTNEPWDVSAIQKHASTLVNYITNFEEKSSLNYENNKDVNTLHNSTPKPWKNTFSIRVDEKVKFTDEFCKYDFSGKSRNSVTNKWLPYFENNNSNLENADIVSFNPMVMSTPEFDRKSKVRNVKPVFQEKYKSHIKTSSEYIKSKNIDTENLNKRPTNKFDVSDENQMMKIVADPDEENLSFQETEKTNSGFVQSKAIILISKHNFACDNCDMALLNNESKDCIVPQKNLPSDKTVNVLELELKNSSGSILGKINSNESENTSSVASHNNASNLISVVSHLNDNEQSGDGNNFSCLPVSDVSSTRNICSMEMEEREKSITDAIPNELTVNLHSKNVSYDEEYLVSSFRSLSLDLENSNHQKVIDASPCKKKDDCLGERFIVTISLSGNKLSDTSVFKTNIEIKQNNCSLSSCSEVGQSSWNEVSHISKCVEQAEMESKISENSKFHSETVDVSSTSSEFTNSDEQFMTIIKLSNVMPPVSISHCSSISSEEFFGFDPKSKVTESTAESYDSIITKIDEIQTEKDVSSQFFDSSEKFSMFPNMSSACLSLSNATCGSTDSSDFVGFSYDMNKDNKNNGKLDFLTEIAGLTNRDSENENLWSKDSIIESHFNINKKSDDQNSDSSSNLSNNSLSDTVVCRIIENKTKELANFNRTDKVVSVTPSRSGTKKEGNNRGCLKKDKTSEIFPFAHRDNSSGCQKDLIANRLSKFEPLLEENVEETSENRFVRLEDTEISADVFISRHRNFTERRKKRYALPTLIEGEAENDDASYQQNSFSIFEDTSLHAENKSTFRQSLFLKKGKKWRRSFITLRNMRDFGLNRELLEDGNKGRYWRRNVENLINIQNDATIFSQEIKNCTTRRTDVEKTIISGRQENDTIERPRFSFCVSIHHPSETTNDTVVNDNSFTWFINESRKSFFDNFEMPAEDCSRNYSIPYIDFSIPNSARDIILHYCKQTHPLPFEECFSENILRNCNKIGEGVYGEVFMIKKRSRCSVIKIIPIEGDQLVNGERQKKYEEILSELMISLELSNLKNRTDFYTNCFAEVTRCWCVCGKYPQILIDLWKKYDLEQGSDNDSPKMFKDDQQYIILELNHGGEDLESFTFNNSQQALSVITQVANALAVAEQAFMFEHRDLHWGNVLVSRCKHKETRFILKDERRTVKLYGVKVTIIDYTLSRISINNRTFYNNIGQDPELFTAEGDLQFEVYRWMKHEVQNAWECFKPKTNVMWLYYLIDKMINEVRYRRDFTKIHIQYLEKLQILYKDVMNYESCYDFVSPIF